MRVWRRSISAGADYGAVALALALLVGSAQEGLAQAPAGQVVSNCTFSETQIAGLKQAIATALGLPNTNSVTTPIVILPSFEDNLGQQNKQGSGPSVGYTGLVICRSATEVGSFGTVQETAPFPSGTADLLELQQTSYVLIQSGSRRSLRICHTDQKNDCFVASE